jgi:hypothetical protein
MALHYSIGEVEVSIPLEWNAVNYSIRAVNHALIKVLG